MIKLKKRNSKAITLIALVITIVVLIILAAVAINLSLGNNGIFKRAKTAKEQYQNAEDYEQTEVAKASNKIESYVEGNRENTYTPMFIDTSRLLKKIIDDPDWVYSAQTYAYTATENCVVIGHIKVVNDAYVTCSVNNVRVAEWQSAGTGARSAFTLYIAKGDTIKFVTDAKQRHIKMNAYGLK